LKSLIKYPFGYQRFTVSFSSSEHDGEGAAVKGFFFGRGLNEDFEKPTKALGYNSKVYGEGGRKWSKSKSSKEIISFLVEIDFISLDSHKNCVRIKPLGLKFLELPIK